MCPMPPMKPSRRFAILPDGEIPRFRWNRDTKCPPLLTLASRLAKGIHPRGHQNMQIITCSSGVDWPHKATATCPEFM